MRVYVVVGVFQGYIEDVKVFLKEKHALEFKETIDEDYGKDTDEDASGIYSRSIITESTQEESNGEQK